MMLDPRLHRIVIRVEYCMVAGARGPAADPRPRWLSMVRPRRGRHAAVRHPVQTPDMSSRTAPQSYRDRLLSELEAIETDYVALIEASPIENIDLNRGGDSAVVFVDFPCWGWVSSSAALEARRMNLLARVRDLLPRFGLLFPHPTPRVSKSLGEGGGLLERWLLRDKSDHSIPPTTDQAADTLRSTVGDLRALCDLLAPDEWPIRLAVDTNALVDEPDLAAYRPVLGPRYLVHVLPVVLGELDDLKRAGRVPDLRDAARRADRRLKGLRDNGDVRVGARVAGDVFAVFEHVEPRPVGLPSWLDLSVPDDRFIASVLRLQSRHPGSCLFVATSDLNLQTKLAAVGLPHVEPPQPESG